MRIYISYSVHAVVARIKALLKGDYPEVVYTMVLRHVVKSLFYNVDALHLKIIVIFVATCTRAHMFRKAGGIYVCHR